jgi:hypothetical protein
MAGIDTFPFERMYGLVPLQAPEFQMQGLALSRPNAMRRQIVQALLPLLDQGAPITACNKHPDSAFWISSPAPLDEDSVILENLKIIIKQEAEELLMSCQKVRSHE